MIALAAPVVASGPVVSSDLNDFVIPTVVRALLFATTR